MIETENALFDLGSWQMFVEHNFVRLKVAESCSSFFSVLCFFTVFRFSLLYCKLFKNY